MPSSLLPQALFFVLSPSIIKEQYTVVNYSYVDLHTDIDISYVLTVYSLYKDGENSSYSKMIHVFDAFFLLSCCFLYTDDS